VNTCRVFSAEDGPAVPYVSDVEHVVVLQQAYRSRRAWDNKTTLKRLHEIWSEP
jgi:hypothetical protein